MVTCALVLGAAGAAFLAGLHWAGANVAAHPWIVWSLPAIGVLTVWAYDRAGKRSAGGTQTLIAEIKDPQEPLPAAMAPMIFCSTLLSHLGGASVGREGTALQMGGALADQFSRLFPLSKEERRTLLLCGVSGGFAAVFGTPWAASVFALEFVRRAELGRFALCMVTALGADWAGQHLFGAMHGDYRFSDVITTTPAGLLSAAGLGLAFGLVGWLFVRAVDHGKRAIARYDRPWMPYATIIVIALAFAALVASRPQFTGLSLGLLDSSIGATVVAPSDFAWKFTLTALCLIAGFRGGEVTPLFVIGACLGATLAGSTALPISIAASLGMTTLFAAAAAVPLAGFVLSLELFGLDIAPYAAACALTAWLTAKALSRIGTGRNSLYAD